jgi:hypothetical protein
MSESVNRISQVVRKKEEKAIEELGCIPQNKYFVCPKYSSAQVRSMQNSGSLTKQVHRPEQ